MHLPFRLLSVRRAAALLGAALALGLGALPAHALTDGESYDYFHDIEIDYAGGMAKLLGNGADPNLRNDKGQPALTIALQAPSLKVAKVLWEAKGIDLEAANNAGETPLMMAALKSEVDATAALVAHGASVNKAGWSPLHYAATGGNAEIVKLLVAHGAKLEARSPNGSTPLMMAARYGSEDAVDALLAAGADRSARNDLGMNAAAFATSGGRDKLAKRLE